MNDPELEKIWIITALDRVDNYLFNYFYSKSRLKPLSKCSTVELEAELEKRKLKWINLMEVKLKRKQFNVEEFISNEKTPVETRIGEKVIIYDTNRVCKDDFYVCGDILSESDGLSILSLWLKDGHFYKSCKVDDKDLFFSIKKVTRRMTNRELSFWLKEHPEEHREICYKAGDSISSTYSYCKDREFHECPDSIFIRYNGGEWKEPLIEE